MSISTIPAFLGPIGGPEIIVILVVLLLGCVPVAIIVGVVLFVNSKKRDAAGQISTESNQNQKTEDG